VPFTPLRLLILTDPAGGLCARVIPRMRQLLEDRAFLVDEHRLDQGAVDISPYRGLIIGSPVFGLGVKGVGPTDALLRHVLDLPDLEGRYAALFCVPQLRPGLTLDRMRGLAREKGAQVVCARSYPPWGADPGEHILPAECMVRIR
jgi:hypothetical protein